MGFKCWLLTRFIPSDWLQSCTLRVIMTPHKTVHINVPEKAFYLHQRDNGPNFVPFFSLTQGVFLLLFYSYWRSRLTILLCLSVCWSSVPCLCFLSTHGGVSIVEHWTAVPQENDALRGAWKRFLLLVLCCAEYPLSSCFWTSFLSLRWCAKQDMLRSTLSSSPAFVRCY